jgi:hypothetical protein
LAQVGKRGVAHPQKLPSIENGVPLFYALPYTRNIQTEAVLAPCLTTATTSCAIPPSLLGASLDTNRQNPSHVLCSREERFAPYHPPFAAPIVFQHLSLFFSPPSTFLTRRRQGDSKSTTKCVRTTQNNERIAGPAEFEPPPTYTHPQKSDRIPGDRRVDVVVRLITSLDDRWDAF